jgi:hypothetical protein
VQGLTADPVRKTYWVYTNLSLFELVAENEDRDVWKIYLDRGKFDVALKYAKVIEQRFLSSGYYLPAFPDSESTRSCSVRPG